MRWSVGARRSYWLAPGWLSARGGRRSRAGRLEATSGEEEGAREREDERCPREIWRPEGSTREPSAPCTCTIESPLRDCANSCSCESLGASAAERVLTGWRHREQTWSNLTHRVVQYATAVCRACKCARTASLLALSQTKSAGQLPISASGRHSQPVSRTA
jgi:hypothetical protein